MQVPRSKISQLTPKTLLLTPTAAAATATAAVAAAQVILAANAGATINDITAAELQPLLSAAAEGDELLRSSLASGQLKVVNSGNDMPVIDVSRVSVGG